MPDAPHISNDSVTLRPHRIEDFAPLYDVFASRRSRHMGGPYDARQMWYWIAADVGSWSLLGHGSWGIEDSNSGPFLGQIGVNQPQHFPEREIGWVLTPSAEGKGVACAPAALALEWYWDQPFADTLVSYITPGNQRSQKLAVRLGATLDPDAALPAGETASETHVYRHVRPQ